MASRRAAELTRSARLEPACRQQQAAAAAQRHGESVPATTSGGSHPPAAHGQLGAAILARAVLPPEAGLRDFRPESMRSGRSAGPAPPRKGLVMSDAFYRIKQETPPTRKWYLIFPLGKGARGDTELQRPGQCVLQRAQEAGSRCFSKATA